MYSLYRAWLSLGPCENLPPLSLLPTQSPLNLAATSTGMPGVPDVTLQVGPSLTQFSAHRAVLSAHSGFFKAALLGCGTAPIAVPNVNVDEFSSLLTFMYTGFLDLNASNIYSILLATHILHMPKALEICRAFLLHSQSQAETQQRSGGVIKPIASRKAMLPTTQIFPPDNSFNVLKKSEDTPFRVVEGTSGAGVASTSKTDAAELVENRKPTEKRSKHRSAATHEKVVVDIACCDGPVRFHRVVNKNYGLPTPANDVSEAQQRGEIINRNAVLNKVMSENIQQNKMEEGDGEQNSEIFTCPYCNHTFKSQYCFQKHARRHLNPVSLEAKGGGGAPKERVAKREVKLLDMNVQYYPCKTCGSKFPSYYFVHKHRKLCHPEEMADNTNKNNEMLPEGEAVVAAAAAEDSSGSAIDVVAINGESN